MKQFSQPALSVTEPLTRSSVSLMSWCDHTMLTHIDWSARVPQSRSAEVDLGLMHWPVHLLRSKARRWTCLDIDLVNSDGINLHLTEHKWYSISVLFFVKAFKNWLSVLNLDLFQVFRRNFHLSPSYISKNLLTQTAQFREHPLTVYGRVGD